MRHCGGLLVTANSRWPISRSHSRQSIKNSTDWQRRIGFRTVELNTSRDEIGTQFAISINGKPVFVKGMNWIPDDHLLTRITAERFARRLDQSSGGQRQPASCLGRWHLRERRLLSGL